MILSHLVGVLESHDGFYDLVIHRTNSPNLLMERLRVDNVGKLQIALLGRSGPSGVGCLTSVPVSPIRVPDNA